MCRLDIYSFRRHPHSVEWYESPALAPRGAAHLQMQSLRTQFFRLPSGYWTRTAYLHNRLARIITLRSTRTASSRPQTQGASPVPIHCFSPSLSQRLQTATICWDIPRKQPDLLCQDAIRHVDPGSASDPNPLGQYTGSGGVARRRVVCPQNLQSSPRAIARRTEAKRKADIFVKAASC